jgi:hypothetical protein
MRDADIPDHRARPGALKRLRHRLLSADAFEHRIRSDAVSQRLDARYAFVTTLGNNVGRAIFEREILPRLMAAHCNDPPGPHLFSCKHAHQAHRAIANHYDRRLRLNARRVRGIPARPQHVRSGQKARDKVVRGHLRRGDQSAVRVRYPRKRCLRPGHEFALLTR